MSFSFNPTFQTTNSDPNTTTPPPLRNDFTSHEEEYISLYKNWYWASTLAQQKITEVNPRLLVFVSALCHGFDMRGMLLQPGPADAMKRHKLVYTSHLHIYPLKWWYTDVNWHIVQVICSVLILVCIGSILLIQYSHCIADHFQRYMRIQNTIDPFLEPEYRDNKDPPTPSAVLWANNFACTSSVTAMLPVGILISVLGGVWKYKYEELHCHTVSANATSFITIGFVFAVCGAFTCMATVVFDRKVCSWVLCQCLLIWLIFICIVFLFISFNVDSYNQYMMDMIYYMSTPSQSQFNDIPIFIADYDHVKIKTYMSIDRIQQQHKANTWTQKFVDSFDFDSSFFA